MCKIWSLFITLQSICIRTYHLATDIDAYMYDVVEAHATALNWTDTFLSVHVAKTDFSEICLCYVNAQESIRSAYMYISTCTDCIDLDCDIAWHNSASLFPASSYSTLTCIGCWFSSGWCNWRNWHWLSLNSIFRLSTSLLCLTIGSWLSSLLCLPGSILAPDVRREVVLEHVTADLPQLLLKLLISAMKYNCVCCRGLSG